MQFASVEEIDRAVASAKAASPTWRTLSLSKRAELFFRIYQLVDEHREDLARLLTAEHGKVLSDALGEVQRGIEVIEYVCGIPELLKGDYSEQASTGIDVYSIRQPLGVVAGITPFNFPAMVPMWMWAPGDRLREHVRPEAVGEGPSASLLTAELLKEAGLPDGVFNVVQGDKVAVDAILQHPDIAAVSFVGSTPIARYVYETGTKAGKRMQALGGAKNHMVVLPDADIDMAADAAVSAGYGSAGERCMAVSVVVAVGDAGDELVGAIKERLPKVKVGDGFDPSSEMGPLVTREHRDKVASYLDSGPAQGATLVADGRETAPDNGGFFLGVSLLDDVTPEMDAYRDEIFGPVLSVVRVPTYDEALRLVNENPYGNGVALFTRDGGVAPAVPVRRERRGWSGSTSRSPCPSRTTRSAAGRARSSATGTSTARRGSTSTPARRRSRAAGRTRRRARSTSASRRRARGALWVPYTPRSGRLRNCATGTALAVPVLRMTMPYIRLIEEAEADGLLAEEYDAAVERAGKVFNILKAMSLRPAVLRASIVLYREIMFGESGLSRKERELLATVASAEQGCHY